MKFKKAKQGGVKHLKTSLINTQTLQNITNRQIQKQSKYLSRYEKGPKVSPNPIPQLQLADLADYQSSYNLLIQYSKQLKTALTAQFYPLRPAQNPAFKRISPMIKTALISRNQYLNSPKQHQPLNSIRLDPLRIPQLQLADLADDQIISNPSKLISKQPKTTLTSQFYPLRIPLSRESGR